MKRHGITSDTPKNIMLGAGVFGKNFTFGEHYEKALSTDVGALHILATGTPTASEILLASVTPVEAGYIPVAGDYVKAITGWYFDELGATNGGGKVTITPEYLDLELDGKTVKVKGLTKKVAEAAVMEINLAEYREDTIVNALHLVHDAADSTTGYKKYDSSKDMADTDYLTNIGFAGFTADNKPIIVIMENAICLSAFENEGKNKEQGSFALTYECTADVAQSDLEHLPYHIYFPTETV